MIVTGALRSAVRVAPWFAALGEPLTDRDLADLPAYADVREVVLVTSWLEAEAFLKSPEK